jgi:hypothetical protein
MMFHSHVPEERHYIKIDIKYKIRRVFTGFLINYSSTSRSDYSETIFDLVLKLRQYVAQIEWYTARCWIITGNP